MVFLEEKKSANHGSLVSGGGANPRQPGPRHYPVVVHTFALSPLN